MTNPSFLIGGVMVVIALVVAYASLNGADLPIVGTGVGALLAVAVIGMAGCAVAGVSDAPILGWSHPFIVVGSVLGVVALVVIGAGLFGWDGVIRPIVGIVPGQLAVGRSTAQLAILALAGVITLKWVIGIAFNLFLRTPAAA